MKNNHKLELIGTVCSIVTVIATIGWFFTQQRVNSDLSQQIDHAKEQLLIACYDQGYHSQMCDQDLLKIGKDCLSQGMQSSIACRDPRLPEYLNGTG